MFRKHYIGGLVAYSSFFGVSLAASLIGKHRGWTHSKLTMLLLPAIFLLLPIYFQREAFDRLQLLSEQNLELLKRGLPFYTASLIGYATHLHLDGILLQSRRAQRRKGRSG